MGLVGPTRAHRGMALCWHIDVKSPNAMVAVFMYECTMYGVGERMWWSGEFRRAGRRRECQSVRWLVVNARTLETRVKVGTMGTLALGRSEGLGKNE